MSKHKQSVASVVAQVLSGGASATPETPQTHSAPVQAPAVPAEPVKVETAFSVYSRLYSQDVKAFVETGRSIMTKMTRAKEASAEAQVQLLPLGLQFAVLAREFFTKHMTTPVWFGKTVGDFLKHTYNLKKEENFPQEAWGNARVVLAIVVPDDGGAPMLEEKHYLALTQRACTVLAGSSKKPGIVLHPKVMANGKADRNNPDLKEALAVCETHGQGYVKKLTAILARLNGETAETKEQETLEEAFDTIRAAILKAGDGDEEKAKALYHQGLSLANCWDQSGVKTDTLVLWTAEYDAKLRNLTPAAPAPAPAEQPALQAA